MSDMSEPYTSFHEQTSKPMAWKGLVFMLLLVVMGAAIGTFILANRSAEGPLVVSERPVPIYVETTEVISQTSFEAIEKFSGLITPRRTSELGFSGSGRIERLNVDTGDKVAKGQRLAELDTRSLRAQLAAAEASVDEAVASYDLALATVDRQNALLAKGHVSKQIVDEAVAQANTSAARIEAARANADTLKVEIDLTRIIAPYDGTITARMVDEGAIAAPGQPIFQLVETGQLEARIGLTDTLSQSLEIGADYALTTDQGEVMARLRSVTGVIDADQRTVTTVFDILDTQAAVAGAVVRISLPRQIDQGGFWVPISALSERDRGLWAVYVTRKRTDGWTAEPGLVEIVHQDGDRVFVRGAISKGDQIILDGLQRITPGQPVTPLQTEPSALIAGNE